MTATLSAPRSVTPLVRIRRAPALEPPTDDDRRVDDHPVCVGQLALFTSIQTVRTGDGTAPLSARPAGAGAAAANGAVSALGATAADKADSVDGAGPAAASGGSGSPAAAHTRSGSATSVTASAAANRFVAVCVEVLNGFRPATHLRALTTPSDYSTVVKQLTRRTARVRMSAASASGRVGLHRVRVFEQRTGVADAVAVLRRGEASWAIALRFERRRGAWLCSLLEVV